MGLITLKLAEKNEDLVLARYRETQRTPREIDAASPVPSSPAPSSAASDRVGQPRGSRLPARESSGSPTTAVSYTVERGDTLRGIADWFYGDRDRAHEIYAANRERIRQPEELEPGTVLRIPRRAGSKPLA